MTDRLGENVLKIKKYINTELNNKETMIKGSSLKLA